MFEYVVAMIAEVWNWVVQEWQDEFEEISGERVKSEVRLENLQQAKTRSAAVAEQTGRLTWIFLVMFDEGMFH